MGGGECTMFCLPLAFCIVSYLPCLQSLVGEFAESGKVFVE